jgi:uncharacterized protein involved in tellurium resistance
MKKVLSLVLVIAMVLSSMSFAFAGTFEDVTGDYEKAVEALVALNVIKGYEDGTFRPERAITRAEVAKVLVEALGYGNLVAGANSSFADTQGHWAAGYVSIAAGTGLVVGYPNGTFQPDKTVTYDEALTMVVRALGYTDASLKGTWPTNYKVKAIDLDLTDDVVMKSAAADRGGVAQVIYNALEANLVEVDADNVATVIKKDGEEQMLIDKIGNKYRDTIDKNNVNPDHDDYLGDVINVAQYMYQEIKGYTNDNDELVYVTKNYSDVVSGVFEADGTTTSSIVGIDVDGSDNEYDLATTAAIKVFYNGGETTMTEAQMEAADGAVTDLKGADVTAVFNDDDKITAFVATKATFGNQIAREYKKDEVKLGSIKLPVKDSKGNLAKVTVTGAVDDIYDIEIDDIVMAYAQKGTLNAAVTTESVKLVVVRDTVEGKIAKIDSDGDLYIDGVEYEVSSIAGATTSYAVLNEGTFFLDDAGKVFAKDASTANNAKDYAVVIQIYDGIYMSGSTITEPKIKLINASGEVVTYVVDEDAKYEGTTTKVAIDTPSVNPTSADINAALVNTNSLVKYKLNDDGEISGLKVVAVNALAASLNGAKASVDTTKSTFDVAENAPIFNIKAGGGAVKANYSVVDIEDLPDTMSFKYSDINDDGEYKVIVSVDAAVSTGTYALITALADITDEDDYPIVEVTAYVDGVKETYNTTTAYANIAAVKAVDTNIVNKGIIASFTLVDGDVSVINVVAPTVTGSGIYVDNSTSTRIHVTNDGVTGTWYDYDVDDITVYVLKSDNKFESVASAEDNLVGYDVVALYDLNADGEYEIVVLK